MCDRVYSEMWKTFHIVDLTKSSAEKSSQADDEYKTDIGYPKYIKGKFGYK